MNEFQYRISWSIFSATVKQGELRAHLTLDSYIQELLNTGAKPEDIKITVEQGITNGNTKQSNKTNPR